MTKLLPLVIGIQVLKGAIDFMDPFLGQAGGRKRFWKKIDSNIYLGFAEVTVHILALTQWDFMIPLSIYVFTQNN